MKKPGLFVSQELADMHSHIEDLVTCFRNAKLQGVRGTDSVKSFCGVLSPWLDGMLIQDLPDYVEHLRQRHGMYNSMMGEIN